MKYFYFKVIVLLSILGLACNPHSLTRALENPETVTRLAVIKKKLRVMPTQVSEMKNLSYLSLKHNDLQTLPPEIGKLTQLETLDLRFNKLGSLPDEMGSLKNLQFLYLTDNNLRKLPATLQNLDKLEIFHIGENDFPAGLIDFDFSGMTALRELSFTNCGPLLEIPESLADLPQLELIYIDPTIVVPQKLLQHSPRLQVLERSPKY